MKPIFYWWNLNLHFEPYFDNEISPAPQKKIGRSCVSSLIKSIAHCCYIYKYLIETNGFSFEADPNMV